MDNTHLWQTAQWDYAHKCAAQGSKLKVRAEGADAREALKAVQTLFDDRFGEE